MTAVNYSVKYASGGTKAPSLVEIIHRADLPLRQHFLLILFHKTQYFTVDGLDQSEIMRWT